MVTIGEVLNKILDLYYQGTPSTSSRKRLPSIYDLANGLRGSLISERLGKVDLSDEFFTTLTIPMERVNHGDFTFFKSVSKIPDLIYVQRVSTDDASEFYQKTEVTAHQYLKSGRFSHKRKGYYIQDDYLFLMDSSFRPCIKIRAIVQNPIEIDNTCKSYMELPFYIDQNMAETIHLMYISKYFNSYRQVPSDKTSNQIADNE